MFNISEYLKKFSKIGQEAIFERDAIEATIKDLCEVTEARFEVRKGIIYLKGPAMLKAAVYMKRDAILASLRARCPQTKIYDIR